MGVYEFRESVVAVLRQVAALECSCPGARTLAARAAEILADVAASGLRVTRWRNPEPEPWTGVAHVAGVVWSCREYRRSCPGYIVDQRQACARCGHELVRGKFGLWFPPGEVVVIDKYGAGPLQLWAWRKVGGALWDNCEPVGAPPSPSPGNGDISAYDHPHALSGPDACFDAATS